MLRRICFPSDRIIKTREKVYARQDFCPASILNCTDQVHPRILTGKKLGL